MINNFSKLSKEEKINQLMKTSSNEDIGEVLKQYTIPDVQLQKLHDEFSENTVSNFVLPFGLAPNFLINDKLYMLPMVTEESSVVAAASKSAKFWMERGGFKTKLLGTEKVGHIHFIYNGDFNRLQEWVEENKEIIKSASEEVSQNMKKRGGGILDLTVVDERVKLEGYCHIKITFDTKDSMGANFINSCLELMAKKFIKELEQADTITYEDKLGFEVVMAILSNYNPNCCARAEVSCIVSDLGENGEEFARKFKQAIDISQIEPYRAVTNNKGIMNGVDALVIATGNDARAVEAGVHAYASRDGIYKGLTKCEVSNGVFRYYIEIPLALGVVGGLTKLHPLAKTAMNILENPNAEELMQIVATLGLAQNYGAISSLVTTGIQQGHMKMHLMNILNQLEANELEKKEIIQLLEGNTVSHSLVEEVLNKIRKN